MLEINFLDLHFKRLLNILFYFLKKKINGV